MFQKAGTGLWNLTAAWGLFRAVNIHSAAWGSIEKLFKNNLLCDCVHVLLRSSGGEPGSRRHDTKGV